MFDRKRLVSTAAAIVIAVASLGAMAAPAGADVTVNADLGVGSVSVRTLGLPGLGFGGFGGYGGFGFGLGL